MAHPRATSNVKKIRLPVLRQRAAPTRDRPQTRADCVKGPRPCPYVACRFNLFLDVKPNGNIRLNFPGTAAAGLAEVDGFDRMPASCVLDVADEGGGTLEAVGDALGITREMVRQMELVIQAKLLASGLAAALWQSLEPIHGPEVDGAPARPKARMGATA